MANMGVVNVSAVVGYKVTKTVSEDNFSEERDESSPHLPGHTV